MLMLLFQVGEERFAVECSRVVEVIPRVKLGKVYQAPRYVAGVLNYRGVIIPAVDLGVLLRGEPCRSVLSTRIIVIRDQNSGSEIPMFGLIAEQVTETLKLSDAEEMKVAITHQTSSYLGRIIRDRQGLIHCLQVDLLLSNQDQNRLFLPLKEEQIE